MTSYVRFSGNEDDLSISAWAHRHRNQRWRTLKFHCRTCNSPAGRHCRTYEGLTMSDRTASHVYRWKQLRKEISNGGTD